MRSFIIHLTILALLGPCLFGCKYHSSNLLLRQADSLLDMKPDSALAILKNVPLSENLSDADQAYYALLTAAATDKSELPLLPCDSLLNLAIDYYDDNDKEMAVALLYKGRLMAQMGDREAAIKNSLEALDVLRNYPEETACRRLIYSALEIWYADYGLYDKSLEASNRSLLYASTPQDSSLIYNNIGFVYLMRDQEDLAIYYQQKALNYARMIENTNLIISYLHNMSLKYDYFENSDSAIYYAREVMKMLPSGNEINKSDYYYNLGNLYLNLAELDSAKFYLGQILSSPDAPISTYNSLSYLEQQLGNYETACHLLEQYALKLDSVLDAESMTQIQHLVYKRQIEMGVKDEQVKSRQRLGEIISIFVLLSFILIIFFQNRISRKSRQQELLRQSLKFADDRLHTMQQRIEENESVLILLQNQQEKNGAEISKREQLIKELNEDKFRLRTWLFEQTPIHKKVIALSSQTTIDKKNRKPLTITEFGKLKEAIFEIYSDYISSLQAEHSRLTDDDLLLLCLQEMGFSSLTIALCFGYTDTATLNQRKSRLKSKMS